MVASAGASLGYGAQVEAKQLAEQIHNIVAQAAEYDLNRACQPTPELLLRFQSVAEGTAGSRDCSWHGIMCLRIRESWKTQQPELIWLDDKVAQTNQVEQLCGKHLHLPILAHAHANDAGEIKEIERRVHQLVADNTPFVAKPQHGANSAFVSLWPEPQVAGAENVLKSMLIALNAHDSSWEKECWQLSQVPRGVILQPLYKTQRCKKKSSRDEGERAPLELKVMVIFGCVVGGFVNGHASELWVTHTGDLQYWHPEELARVGVPRCRRRGVPDELTNELQAALQRDWGTVHKWSEHLTRAAGLDELRVDWLLGDEHWGPRIGELTFMGAGARIAPPILSECLAVAYCKEHARRYAISHNKIFKPNSHLAAAQ